MEYCLVVSLLWWCLAVVVVIPQQTGTQIRYSFTEELQNGTIIGNIFNEAELASRYSTAELQNLKFQLLSKPDINIGVDESSGNIKTTGIIDRDVLCPYQDVCKFTIDVVALIPDPLAFLEIMKVVVTVQDLNDNQPTFPDKKISKVIPESKLTGSIFVIPTAVDPDSGRYGIQSYELIGGDDKFDLEVQTKVDESVEVRLILKDKLDREEMDYYQLKVIASDGGQPPRSGSVQIDISVQDTNDNDPIFRNSTYEVLVSENILPQSSILQVVAFDSDEGAFGRIRYGFSDSTTANYGDLFGIESQTGVIYIKGQIDYEQGSVYHLTVTALDQGPDSIPADATVIVRVQDINDNMPVIVVNTITAMGTDSADIGENVANGTFVAHLTVSDPDSGANGQFDCALNDNHFRLEQIYEREYKIATRKQLDRELQSEYNLAIMCTDKGKDPQVAIKHLHITVKDVNDNDPRFKQTSYAANLIENNQPGAFVAHVNASDLDVGKNGQIVFSLEESVSGLFDLEPRTGIIRTKVRFDHEEVEQIKFKVIARDRGDPQRSATAAVVVNINDVNDERPKFSQPTYSFGVYENEPEGTEVGVVHAVDADSEPYNYFEFSLLPSHSGMSKFAIDPYSGKISTNSVLDREEQAVYYLVVMASDRAIPPLSSTASVSVYVSDKNDNAPLFEYPSQFNNTLYLPNSAPKGYVITRMRAFDHDIGPNGNLTYHIARGNSLGLFNMDVNKGTLMVNANLGDVDFQVFELVILVQDQGVPTKTATTNLNIIVNKSLVFQPESKPALGYNFTIVVSMATVSSIVVIILIIAIVIIRRQDHHTRPIKYVETAKVVSPAHGHKKGPGGGGGGIKTGADRSLHNNNTSSKYQKVATMSPSNCAKHVDSKGHHIPSVSHQVSISAKSTPTHQSGNATPAHACALQMSPKGKSSKSPSHSKKEQVSGSQEQQQPHIQQKQQNTAAWALSQNELQVHRFLGLMKTEGDSSSTSSEEGSHADSGRGPSEAGDQTHHHVPPPPPPPSTHKNLTQQLSTGTPSRLSQGRLPVGIPHLQDPRWSSKPVTSYSSHPTKMQTFTGSNSNTSADSGFRESGSDREVSDVDNNEIHPDNQLRSMAHPHARTHTNLPPRTRNVNFAPHIQNQRHVLNNSCHSNPASCLGKNCTCQQGMLSNPAKQAIRNKNLYAPSNYRVRPAENIQLKDLSPRTTDNSYVLNLQESNNSDTGTICSDVVV